VPRRTLSAPPAPAMAADRVYDAIYAAVIDHRLPPGARLREEELAQTFAVSRTLVRQALHRLAQDGVVVLRPNRGAQVPEPTRAEGAHVFDARRVVECEVVRRLAGSLEKAQVAGLKRLVDAEERATAAGDHREAIRLSGAFHVELARLSGNPLFVRMLEELLPTTSLLMALYKPAGPPQCWPLAAPGWRCTGRVAASTSSTSPSAKGLGAASARRRALRSPTC
jgi:DNA-binding GntR family transcriptional regulator